MKRKRKLKKGEQCRVYQRCYYRTNREKEADKNRRWREAPGIMHEDVVVIELNPGGMLRM